MRLPALLVLIATFSHASEIPDASRWTEPRHFHTSATPEFAKKITIIHGKPTQPGRDAVYSPNKVYWYRSLVLDSGTDSLGVATDKSYWSITIQDRYANFPLEIRWINEKLLFLRIYWGRVIGTDLIFDAEKGVLLHQETVHDGQLLFEQSKSR